MIESVKKGLYIVGRFLGTERPESALLANHILGSSYLSMESALAHYGLIPEKVFAVTSMTIKHRENFRLVYTIPIPTCHCLFMHSGLLP